MPNRSDLSIWRGFLALSTLAGLAAMAVLARLPSDGGLLGFSARRLLILAGMALLAGACAALLVLLGRASWAARWQRATVRAIFLPLTLLLAAGLVLLPPTLLDWLGSLFQATGEYRYRAYAERLAPLLFWLALEGVLLLGAILLARRRELAARLADETAALKRWGWIGLGLLLVALLIAASGLGLHALDPLGSWGTPTVPLLEWQVALAGLLVAAAAVTVLRGPLPQRADRLVALGVWALAAALWAGAPLVPGYFATAGRAPNFEIYPFSDGATYAQHAQSILIGNGFIGEAIPQRALYLVFLAGLHWIMGQDYSAVIFGQTLVLALLPALIYRTGVELHSRPAGLLAALLVILRELTAIQAAPFTDNISYSKLYFSELPTALCLAAFTFCLLRWLKNPRRAGIASLLAGGFLGMAMLIRTQSLAALPLALLAGWIAGRRAWRALLPGAALLAAGLVVTIAPWLVRNYPLAGGLAFDNPASQTMVLAQRYNGLHFDQIIPRQAGESEARYSSRLVRMAVDGIRRNPGEAAWLVSNHFVNNEIDNLLLLPVRFELPALRDLGWPASAFWQAWDGHASAGQLLLIGAALALLAAGLAGSSARLGALGWIPLLVNLAYNFSTAIFRSSGGRFLTPADWPFLLLFAVGLAQIGMWLWALSCRAPLPGWFAPAAPAAAERAWPRLRSLALGLGLFALVGLSLPLSQVVFPARYPAETGEQRAAQLLAGLDPADGRVEAVRALLATPGSEVIRGRALYPRFYAAGESEPRTAKTGYAGMDFARLVFYVVGSADTLAVLPLDAAPRGFPHAGDVWLAGCRRDAYFEVVAVRVENSAAIFTDGALPTACTP